MPRASSPLGFFGLASLITVGLAIACGSTAPESDESNQGIDNRGTTPIGQGLGNVDSGTAPGTVPKNCGVPAGATEPSANISLAAAFAKNYHAYDLGPIPGVPSPLGGVVVKSGDENTLIVVGRSEYSDAALYTIKVNRDACKHITGWNGTGTKLMDAPYADANLLYGPSNALIYSMWSATATNTYHAKLAQRADGASSYTVLADIKQMSGVSDQGPGGIGFVPSDLTAAGQLRGITQPNGDVLHIAWEKDGTTGIKVISATKTGIKLNGVPGGFAYVPTGSPGFPKQRMIVAEWEGGVVSTYEVDPNGDPILRTRELFFDKFPAPWGAYFDVATGDYLFITWGGKPDHVITVQGFAVPSSAGPK